MAKLILFSGGCNSGKTTTLKAVASKLQSLGYKVNILDEIIRKETNKPIDELRKDAKAYFRLSLIRLKNEMSFLTNTNIKIVTINSATIEAIQAP